MKKTSLILITILLSILLFIPVMGSEIPEGFYSAETGNGRYEFREDGTVSINGKEGTYFTTATELTVLLEGLAYKYHYELFEDKLILYEVETGTVYDFVDEEDWVVLFELDYGITWGMTMDEVRDLSPESFTAAEDNVLLTETYLTEEDLFEMTGTAYYFEGGELTLYVEMNQNDDPVNKKIFNQLKNEVVKEYGEPYEVGSDFVLAVINEIAAEGYEPRLSDLTSYCWEDNEGTKMLLTSESNDDQTIYYLFYLSPAFLEHIE